MGERGLCIFDQTAKGRSQNILGMVLSKVKMTKTHFSQKFCSAPAAALIVPLFPPVISPSSSFPLHSPVSSQITSFHLPLFNSRHFPFYFSSLSFLFPLLSFWWENEWRKKSFFWREAGEFQGQSPPAPPSCAEEEKERMKVTERECVTQLERKKIEIPSHMHYFTDKNRLFQKNIFFSFHICSGATAASTLTRGGGRGRRRGTGG